jgi:hypothetical protein
MLDNARGFLSARGHAHRSIVRPSGLGMAKPGGELLERDRADMGGIK